MKIIVRPSARDDLSDGFDFYERQGEGLGNYFAESLLSDIGSLRLYAGIPSNHLVIIDLSRSASLTQSITI